MNCGLLGRKLAHSYSPQIHSHLGAYSYPLFEKEPEELEVFLRQGNFTGLNVTIPYKKAVIPYCDELTPIAQILGAVNTIVRRPDGTLIGHNTDFYGFSSMVKKAGVDVSGKKVLVLGSGGASVTAVAVLKKLGARVIVISRSGADNYENLDRHQDAALIVNATPVGMYPNNGSAPLSLEPFSRLEAVLDLIYNPARTALLLEAEKRNISWENGLWMLVAQAKESAEWFTGASIAEDRIGQIYRTLQSQMENIILVGMPGCGKSSVGKALAERLHRELIDADEVLVQASKCSIPEIFASEGEAGFRTRETAVLRELGKASGKVIATGGGCVTRADNYPALHQNGRIIWLKRDISTLPTDGRPLSQRGSLEQMYQIRKPLYEAFADLIAENTGTIQDTVLEIIDKGEYI